MQLESNRPRWESQLDHQAPTAHQIVKKKFQEADAIC
jgi:hypothetical protein